MTTSHLDLTDPAFVADPYPALAELRAAGDLLWHEPSGRWLATTHAAVTRVLRDRSFGRLWTDHEPADVMEPFNTLHRNQLMENEPPEHTRMRRLLQGAFGRGHVERLRPGIESLAAEMVARLVPGSDLLADFADYCGAQARIDRLYAQPALWNGAVVRNIAGMGGFSADRTVQDYVARVWSAASLADGPRA